MLTSDERTAMITRAEAEWGELHHLMMSFSAAELVQPATCGDWSVRDVLVHIANWEEDLLRIVGDLEAGRQPAPTYTAASGGIDAWNAAQVLRFQNVPLDEVRSYFEDTHAAVMELLRTSAHVKSEWMAGMYGGGHLEDLQALRARLDRTTDT